MTENTLFESDDAAWIQKHHGLRCFYAPLETYLSSGLHVLDVGCGPGHVTVDVAEIVSPGLVVGVDREERMLREARALVDQIGIGNVSFQLGDAYALDFSDTTFDVTYCTALLEWLREPVRALREQRRVTKKGGWVVAGMGDWGTRVIYPPCPAGQDIWEALHHLNDPSDSQAFANLFAGREALGMFSEAGFKDIRLQGVVNPIDIAYAGSEYFEFWYRSFKGSLEDPGLNRLVRRLVDKGVISEETIETAKSELEAWHNHPHAFHMATSVLIAGKVE